MISRAVPSTGIPFGPTRIAASRFSGPHWAGRHQIDLPAVRSGLRARSGAIEALEKGKRSAAEERAGIDVDHRSSGISALRHRRTGRRERGDQHDGEYGEAPQERMADHDGVFFARVMEHGPRAAEKRPDPGPRHLSAGSGRDRRGELGCRADQVILIRMQPEVKNCTS